MTVELISAFVFVLFLVIIYERRCYNLRCKLSTLEDWNDKVYSAYYRATDKHVAE